MGEKYMKIEKEIKKIIKKSKNVFIIGHKNLDLDALGACVGISAIANHFNKPNYIIIDDKKNELGVDKALTEIKDEINIIKSDEIPKYHHKNSSLIIVDTNKAHLLQSDKILHYFNEIIILDHHQSTDQTIETKIKVINEEASSACEIVTNLIKKYNVRISEEQATIILSGIVLDTNNFVVKTDKYAYYSAYYLTKNKANPTKVQYYLKQDIKDYIIRQKVITEVEIINGKYALSVAPEKLKYKREDLAKIADTLLQFNNIEASFVLGNRVDGGIGLSARSQGIVNVGEIAENLGGGGDNHDAAAQIKNLTLKKAKEELIKIIK